MAKVFGIRVFLTEYESNLFMLIFNFFICSQTIINATCETHIPLYSVITIDIVHVFNLIDVVEVVTTAAAHAISEIGLGDGSLDAFGLAGVPVEGICAVADWVSWQSVAVSLTSGHSVLSFIVEVITESGAIRAEEVRHDLFHGQVLAETERSRCLGWYLSGGLICAVLESVLVSWGLDRHRHLRLGGVVVRLLLNLFFLVVMVGRGTLFVVRFVKVGSRVGVSMWHGIDWSSSADFHGGVVGVDNLLDNRHVVDEIEGGEHSHESLGVDRNGFGGAVRSAVVLSADHRVHGDRRLFGRVPVSEHADCEETERKAKISRHHIYILRLVFLRGVSEEFELAEAHLN